METWMIVWAIVLATLIMIGFGAFRKWFKKSKIVNEVREGVASVKSIPPQRNTKRPSKGNS